MGKNFQPGDLVKIKSGGPIMTVENNDLKINGKAFIECVWFDGAVRQSARYHPAALVAEPKTEE